MVTHLLDAPPRVVNDVPVTLNSLSPVIATGAIAAGAACPSGRG